MDLKPVTQNNQFVIYDINVISYKRYDTYSSIFAHCEITTPGEPGGEAFSLSAIENPTQEDSSIRLEKRIIFLKYFEKKKLMEFLQNFIDGAHAKTWTELRIYVSQQFDWV